MPELVLEKMAVAAVQRLHPAVLHDAHIDTEQLITGELAVRMRGFLLSNPAGRIVYSFPATPWDHWKRDHAPAWFLRRFPVRWSHDVRSAAATYPEANVAVPPELGRVVFQVREDR
jgi:hypothetical protein